MKFYSAHIEFDDGTSPWLRYRMDRNEYGRVMKEWLGKYELTILDSCKSPNGDALIFFGAKKRPKQIKIRRSR